MMNSIHRFLATACAALAIIAPQAHAQGVAPSADGLIKVKSAYSVDETIDRIKQDIAAKGIVFFMAVDQAKLAADRHLKPAVEHQQVMLETLTRRMRIGDVSRGIEFAFEDLAGEWTSRR